MHYSCENAYKSPPYHSFVCDTLGLVIAAVAVFPQRSGSSGHQLAVASPLYNIKEIIKSARKEELTEERDKSFRAKNIIIHGVKEPNENELSTKDQDFVYDLIVDLYVNVTNGHV